MVLKRPRLLQRRALCAFVLMAAFLGLQCGRGDVSMEKPDPSPAMAPNTTIPFKTLAKGSDSAITLPRRIVIRTDADWRQLWSEHMPGLVASPPSPQVDFRTQMVIAVFRGNTEGGFPITITEIQKRGTELVVVFEELSPPPGFPLGVGVVLQPYHIVQVESLLLPVVFQRSPFH